MTDPLDMSGHAVIVTGGCRGIGRGITARFLEHGADVVICCRHEPEELPRAGGRAAVFVAADVREPDDIDRVVTSAVERFGRLDVVVNNAGGSPAADAATASPRFSTAGEPGDVADACLFLASPLARYISGGNLVVHGGGERPAYLGAASV